MQRRLATAALVLAAAFPLPAAAGLFDDEEARKQITDLIHRTDERFDTSAKAQLELSRQIESLTAELARLRGQIEVLTYELDAAQKRQRDFYVDLDNRVRTLEKAAAEAVPAVDPNAGPAKPKVDPLAETRDYEAALNLFKQGKYKDALAAFEGFQKTYPESTLAASAQFWLGNTHYALRDCKKAIEAQNLVPTRWPTSPKAPDALLAVATCQQEQGAAAAARKTLETIVAKYPDAPAGETARQRLKKR